MGLRGFSNVGGLGPQQGGGRGREVVGCRLWIYCFLRGGRIQKFPPLEGASSGPTDFFSFPPFFYLLMASTSRI